MNLCPIKLDRIDGLIGGMQSRIANLEKHSSRADDASFAEHQHPRGPDGKFTSGGGTSSYLSSLKGKKATRAGLAMHLLKTGLYSKKDVISAVKELHTHLPGKEAPFHLGPKDVDFYWNAANKKSIDSGKGPIPEIPHSTKGWNPFDAANGNDYWGSLSSGEGLGTKSSNPGNESDELDVTTQMENAAKSGQNPFSAYSPPTVEIGPSSTPKELHDIVSKISPNVMAKDLKSLFDSWDDKVTSVSKKPIYEKLKELKAMDDTYGAGKVKPYMDALKQIEPIPGSGMAISSFNSALNEFKKSYGINTGAVSAASPSYAPTTSAQKQVYDHLKHTPHFEVEHVNRFEDKTGNKVKAVLTADTSKIPGDYYARAMSALGPNGENTSELGKVMKEYGKHCNQQLSTEEKYAAMAYIGNDYKAMNKAMLGKTKASSSTQEYIDNMQTAVKKSVIPANVKLYRGLKCSLKDLSGFDDIEHSIGRAFVHKNFVSATRRKDMLFVVDADTVLHFNAVAGTTGLVVNQGQEGDEEEIVFPHDSAFRIDKVELLGFQHHVHVTMLGVKDDE